MAEPNFEGEIKRMQDLFGVLKHEYDLYFAGARKGPPSKEREEIEKFVRLHANGGRTRLSEQFLFNAFVAKFTLHCEQWNKWLLAKQEGVVADPRLMGPTRATRKTLYELEKSKAGTQQKDRAPSPRGREPASEPSKDQPFIGLYDEFVQAHLQAGAAPGWDYPAFEANVLKQRKSILEKHGGRDVSFSVHTKEGKVTLKAKVVR